jgi:hypothetical protein
MMAHDSWPVVAAALAIVAGAASGVSGAAASVHGETACPNIKQRSVVLISVRTGRVDCSFPDISGPPASMVSDGKGGWFVATTEVGDVPVDRIAHLRPDGRLDRTWHVQVPHGQNTFVAGLIRVGETLYAAGGSWVGSYGVRTGARRWLVRTNRRGGWNSFAADRSTVFVGGYSGTPFNGTPHRAPVALDARTGRVLAWHAALTSKFLYLVGPLVLDRGSLFLTALGRRAGTAETVAVNARSGRLTGWRASRADTGGPALVTHGLVLAPDQSILSERTGQPVQALAGIYGAVFTAFGRTLYVAGDCHNGSSFNHLERDDIGAVNLLTDKVTSWAPRGFRRSSALGFACFGAMAADGKQVLVAVD